MKQDTCSREDLVNVLLCRRKGCSVSSTGLGTAGKRLLGRRLTGAVYRHTDDVFPVREWSRGHQYCLFSLLWSYGEFLFFTGCAVNKSCVDVQEMNPNFVAAALVCNLDAKCFVRNFERTVHANMPLGFRPRWLDESTYVGPFT